MKKILFFIAISTFSAISFTSCSEDEPVMETPTPNPNPNVGAQLKISSDAKFIKEKNLLFVELGQKVTLTTTSGTTPINDVTYYVDGVKMDGNVYEHKTIANVKFQAKRAGFIDSEIITIQFAQHPY
ncbi:hypothetical protein H1R17_10485 [Flavobacterium sp. xlx-214]|uniref:hypothetical protein n=1 Tax=unclassified Flavobacterium TaxID=196869 RepID=UPI0013D3D9A6|nr:MULTISPECIES: hypothetical protein [unclassified Flavobacterium]MBA5791642.1 hypothetical protein [Flavobacterium sp. xlx-221]QMI82886.1 hypothetical protein H1R17_10485 [Flavobacterium sp. xlx-214]